jgi:NitT/TauT family transport system substrate-binding protein
LISGDIQYSTSAASSVSAILKGAPLKVIYTNSDHPGYELWSSSPDVKTLADLAGKTIAVQSRGDTMEIAARLALEQHGVDPDSVSYIAVGYGSAQRLAALQTGSTAAAILGIADVVQLKNAGPTGHLLANIRDDVEMLYTGLATSDQELQQHRDRVKRLLQATLKGREYYKAFKDETLAILGKYNDRPRDANEADYEDVMAAMTPDGAMPVEVQQRDTAMRAAVNGVDQVPPVDQIYDYSVVKEVAQALTASGWKPTR